MTAPGEVTTVTLISTRADLARWTRAHTEAPGLHWSVEAGPGGTMLIAEHVRDRSSQSRTAATSTRTEAA